MDDRPRALPDRLRGVPVKAKAVTAFECARCHKLRRDKVKAEACCTCRCGKAVSPRFYGKCTKCGARNAARALARSIKGTRERLSVFERRLTELRAEASK